MKPWVVKVVTLRQLFIRGMTFARLWQQFALVAIMLRQWEIPQWPWMPIGAVLISVISILWGYAEDRLGILEAEQQFWAKRTPMLRDIHKQTEKMNECQSAHPL